MRDAWDDGMTNSLEQRVRHARSVLHELTQAVAMVVGAAELLPLQPAGSVERHALEGDLALAAQLLTQRTERLRSVLRNGCERSRTPLPLADQAPAGGTPALKG